MITPTLLDTARRMDGKKKKWIAKSTENSHGQFRAKAEAAGKSTKEFAQEKSGSKGLVGKQARLALSLMGASGAMKKNHGPSPKDMRSKMYGDK